MVMLIRSVAIVLALLAAGDYSNTQAGVNCEIQSSVTELDFALLTKGYTCLTFERSTYGYHLLHIWHKDKMLRFLVDTGSPFNAPDKARTAHLDLVWNFKRHYVDGSTRTYTVDTCKLNEIQIQSHMLKEIEFIARDFEKNNDGMAAAGESKIDGLLGIPFLRANKAVIDCARSRIYLKVKK